MNYMSKVLIIVDMQNDFIDGVLGTKEAQNIVSNVVDKIKSFSGNIAVTMDTHDNDYLNTQEGKCLPVKHCIYKTSGWHLNNTISDALENKPFRKYIKHTFGSQHLAYGIQGLSDRIEEIELVGVCTDICVISNALLLKAFVPEIKITVDASCCAGVTPESHRNALDSMKMCHINVINE
jgi:nicotinamidase-related amidase